MVNRAQSAKLLYELVKKHRLKCVARVRDGGFLTQNHGSGALRIGAQQSPVDIRAVSEVGVGAFFSGDLEHLGDYGLSLIRLFQEQLDGRSQQLQLDLQSLFSEGLSQALQLEGGVINLV